MKVAPNPEPLLTPPAMASAKLRIERVVKTFQNATQTVEALQPMSLDVQEGEYVVLFGPSGCGKSTLLNLVAGFEEPTDGTIFLDGKEVKGPGNDRLMMFQEHALFPWLNVIDNVMYGLKWERAYRFRFRARRKRAMELLEMVHLTEFARSSIHELSGGMKQRVALARALAPDPQVLLIDEPFPALDALVRAKLYAQLQDILVRTRKTILSVTHDPHEAACLADRVVVFTARPGRLKTQIQIDLPRPRDINDPQVADYARGIAAELEDTNEEEFGTKP
ncbi:MAG: ABC transporter ATP-binding protein [Verrucomicrobia bacterium]|nr:ABC transporter ATP-binding protein [Verrucomicrobiota bacterium]MBI3867251.1 ABC transporter ATP-binding protein [Verrucomicrobiota bacterium]